jgi:tRNA pseudouridine55 synthase
MDGVLIINKPKGYTSYDVVSIVKKKLSISKVGHTGTLDPNATGVLPILVGKATKISKYLIEHNKTYVAELRLGEKSATGDIEGEIVERKSIPNLKENKIKETLETFLGKQMQKPPIYSSIKINGKKAYEYARKGQTVEIEPRKIEIMEISLIKFENNIITFSTSCSKGTYIRVLCEDIAEKLGTVGLMQNLIRTRVDKFDIKDSFTLENVEKANIIGIEEIFINNKKIELDRRKTELFLNGVKLNFNEDDGLYRIYNNNIFIGLGIIKSNSLKRDVIIIDNFKNNV